MRQKNIEKARLRTAWIGFQNNLRSTRGPSDVPLGPRIHLAVNLALLQEAGVEVFHARPFLKHSAAEETVVLRQLPVLPAERKLATQQVKPGLGFGDLASTTLLKYRAEQRTLLEANVKLAEGMWRRLLRSANLS